MIIHGNTRNVPILEIGLNSTTVQETVRPDTNNKIDLGDVTNSLKWRNIYASGVIDGASGFAVNGTSGWSGWFDDGVNFRVTVTNGIITSVANSSGGGHS